MTDKSKRFKLRDIQKCAGCDRGLLHQGNALGLFWRLTYDRLMIDRGAVQRQHGLEMMLGGAAGLAQIMGPDEDMAKPWTEPVTALICETCMMEKPLMVLMQVVEDRAQKAEAG